MCYDELWFSEVGTGLLENFFSKGESTASQISHPPLVMVIRAAPFYFFIDHSLPKEFKRKSDLLFPYRNKALPLNVKGVIAQSDSFLYTVRNTIFWFRIPSLFFWLLLLGVVYQWSKSLYGYTPAVLAVFLISFEPNLTAHSILTTTDFGCVTFMCLALYCFYRFLENINVLSILLAGITLGMALASKYYAIELFLIYTVLCLLWMAIRKLNLKQASILWGSYILIAVLALLVLSLIYTALKAYPPHAPMPMLIPYNYIYGIQHRIISLHYGNVHETYFNFLLGHHSQKGWWYYFLIAFLIKTPLSLLGLLMFRVIWCRQRQTDPLSELVLIVPVIIHTFLISFFNHIDIGIRHLLFIYPLLIIWISGICHALKSKVHFICLGVLLGWFMLGSVLIYPNYIAYFNEIIAGPKNGYKYLADSNIDDGENEILIHEYLKAHQYLNPPVIVNPVKPVTGTIIVNVDFLNGLAFNKNQCEWLKGGYQPVGNIGYSWLLYRIPAKSVGTK